MRLLESLCVSVWFGFVIVVGCCFLCFFLGGPGDPGLSSMLSICPTTELYPYSPLESFFLSPGIFPFDFWWFHLYLLLVRAICYSV